MPLITNSYADGIVTRGYKYTFKLTPQGGAIWNWSMTSAYEMWKATKGSPPKTAAIFMSNDAVGLVVQKQLPEHAKTLDLEVPFSTGFQMGLSDPSVAVAPVLRYKPDMLFLGGFTNDLLLIVKALRGVGATMPIFGAGPAGANSIGKGLGAAADRFFAPMTWNWDLPVPGNKEFVAAYKAAYPTQPYPPAAEMLGQGYVMGLIIGQALEKAASRDPKTIRDVLASTEFTGPAVPRHQGEVRRQRPQRPQPEHPGRVAQGRAAHGLAERGAGGPAGAVIAAPLGGPSARLRASSTRYGRLTNSSNRVHSCAPCPPLADHSPCRNADGGHGARAYAAYRTDSACAHSASKTRVNALTAHPTHASARVSSPAACAWRSGARARASPAGRLPPPNAA